LCRKKHTLYDKNHAIRPFLWIFTGGAMADTALKTATFAGGCFWCMQGEFDHIDGVSKVMAGYTGGTTRNPTYEQVAHGDTGHVEAIEITYDPKKASYQKLLDIFWENIDPLDEYGQFCDKGSEYRAGIFYHDDEQKKLAEASKEKVKSLFSRPVATVLNPLRNFLSENYHHGNLLR